MSLKTDVVSKLEKVSISDFLKQKDLLYKGRREHKFLVPLHQVSDILDYLNDDFYCIVHDDGVFFSYRSAYFDSDDFSFFNMHRQGKYNRMKLRIREYKSGKKGMYIESKRKAKAARYTIKQRKKVESLEACLDKKFIKESLLDFDLEKENLKEKVHINYKRIFWFLKMVKEESLLILMCKQMI